MYNKIIFTNGSGEPINDENLNHMQEQYFQAVLDAIRIKQSQSYAACVRSDIYQTSQALDGEIYIVPNPNLEDTDESDLEPEGV